MSKTKEEFREQNMLKLQGKDYLPVAPRVVLFRQEHPEWTVHTDIVQVGDDFYVKAMVESPQFTIATAHKRVRNIGEAKGPAGQWPLETAETGAIGRALALCGYGTLAGDLDEGDELADAPVEREAATNENALAKKHRKAKKSSLSGTAAQSGRDFVAEFDALTTKAEFDAIYDDALKLAGSLDPSTPEYLALVQAGIRARHRVVNGAAG